MAIDETGHHTDPNLMKNAHLTAAEQPAETLPALERALETLPDNAGRVAGPVVAAAREGLGAGTT